MKKVLLGLTAVFSVTTMYLAGSVTAQAAEMYWAKWNKGKAELIVPDCGVNVLPIGGDDILQATVDIYCGLKPGSYRSWINPKVMDIYNARKANYPDGQTAVLEFPDTKIAFTTDHKDGKPIYDVISTKDGKSMASKEPKHPLNPQVCFDCHAGFKGACVGAVCGNR